MIGDIVLIKPEHIIKAKLIEKEVLKIYQQTSQMVLLIGGGSGTGKTECAHSLQRMLYEDYKIKCKVIHIDNYYYTMFNDRNSIRKKIGINSVGSREINWKLLNKAIKDFKKNVKTLQVQRIHKYLDSIEYVEVDGRSIDILIVDGLYALMCKRGFKVFLEGTISDTYAFRKERHKEDPDNEFRKLIVQKEYEEILTTKKSADLIIPHEVKNEKKNTRRKVK